jgi:tRNA(Ile2) C34 agmatinyltransferase TiaS
MTDYEKRRNTSETECICPRCGEYHEKELDWKGRFMPRYFCEKCKAIIREKDIIEEHRVLSHDSFQKTFNLR